jgi:hypothetical protein
MDKLTSSLLNICRHKDAYQGDVDRMIGQEWMPVNPCGICQANKTCSKIESFCTVLCRYKATSFAQKELLKYLISFSNNQRHDYSVSNYELEEMLEQLEAK